MKISKETAGKLLGTHMVNNVVYDIEEQYLSVATPIVLFLAVLAAAVIYFVGG